MFRPWTMAQNRFRCSPPARWRLLDLSQLFSSSASSSSSSSTSFSSSSLSSSFSSTTFASTPMFTSALPTLRQAPRQLPRALQGSERTGHRWTSTWDLPSSVSTAGPQPGTVRAQWAPLDLNLGPLRAQWAPLDLNLGPSELSEHRWTSTAR